MHKKRDYLHKVGVSALVINRSNEILLGERNVTDNKGKWELLGGLIKNTETLEEAVVRQAEEEAGIKVKPLTIIGHYDRYFDDKNQRDVGLTFICEHISGEPQITSSKKVSNFKWTQLDEALRLNLTPYTKIQLQNYKKWLSTVKAAKNLESTF